MQRAKNCKKKKVSFLVTKRANFHHVETQNTTKEITRVYFSGKRAQHQMYCRIEYTFVFTLIFIPDSYPMFV
jgi:hypothetical protein